MLCAYANERTRLLILIKMLPDKNERTKNLNHPEFFKLIQKNTYNISMDLVFIPFFAGNYMKGENIL